MYLSSLRRLRNYSKLSDTVDNNRMLSLHLAAASLAVEEHLGRELELKARTEDFDSEEGQVIIYPKAFPVTLITSLHTSATGLFTGEETLEPTELYHLTPGGRAVRLRFNVGKAFRGARLAYTGGLAADPVESTLTLTGVGSAAFESTQFVLGSKSGAVAKVVSNAVAESLVIENIHGQFRPGDVLAAYVNEELSGNPVNNTAGTISAIPTSSLAQAHPNICFAVEAEVNYLVKNTTVSNLWTTSTSKDSTNKRPYGEGGKSTKYTLQPETRLFLQGYERFLP